MSLESAFTSFSLGLLAMTSPCVLPLYPGFLAYLSAGHASRRGASFLGFFVLAGVMSMMLALGLVISLLSVSIGSALAVVVPLADLMILVLGILLLADINPFKRLPQIRVPVLSHPFINAYLYGLLYGPIALPCSGPLVVSIFALSFTASAALGRLGVFFWFGLGFGLPLLILSLLSAQGQRFLTHVFTRYSRLINIASGLLLIGIAFYDLWQNWELILAYLS